MILALSSRMFERRTGYEFDLDGLASLVSEIGYGGLELRRRQVNESTSPAEIAQARGILGRHSLRCAYLTVAGLENATALDDATRLLAVGLALDCQLVRVQLVREEEIALAQELADRAAERGLRVMSQIHHGTLFANVDMALKTLGKIARDNYGVAFEASQLMLDGQQEHGEGAVRELGDRVFACFLEAFKPAPEGSELPEAIYITGKGWLPALPGEQGSADLPSVFRGLHGIGFDGFVVVTAQRHPQVESRNLARVWHDYARKVMEKAGEA
ncbi:MAG: sugar phosphate isomerase/epimerase [Armatimonadota bacterium]|nr:MAG: sugar phosphate isomerase/epimerase [Armatimonadota bacterium]